MAHDCSITSQLKRRQQAMFLEAANRGITHKQIHYEANLSLSIIGQYARGETAMGGPAMLKIRRVVGAELFTMLLDDGDHLIEAPADIDHDDLAAGCIDYASAHARARHPDSPGGVEIMPCEDTELKGRAARLKVA
jgi:hypothetical protein